MEKKKNITMPDEEIKDITDNENKDEDTGIITLEMDDGSQKDFVALDILSHEGQNYIALSELESMEYDVLRFEEVDDELELSIIEDDEEYGNIANLFTEHFAKLAKEAGEEEE